MAAPTCTGCGSTSLTHSDVYGANVCSRCGVVQEFDSYEHHFGGFSGQPVGTFVKIGTNGPGSSLSYRERKLYNADCTINEITQRLSLSEHSIIEVRTMVEKVTSSEFGHGDWFTVLIGACAYIVRRKMKKPLPISDVANAVECDAYELGRMVDRVVRYLGLDMPEFDIVSMLESTIKGYSGFGEVSEEKVNLMVKQGCFVVQCTIKWFLTTGRRPGPVVVAVLVFVAGLNGFKEVKIADVAREVNVAEHTCKKRYNELLVALVRVARNLPWGKDVNVKNIMQNAPFVIQYMEMKSRGKKVDKKRKRTAGVGGSGASGSNGVGIDLNELIDACLSGGMKKEDGKSVKNDSSYYGGGDGLLSPRRDTEEVENFKVSYETLGRIYSKFSGSDGPAAELPSRSGGGGEKRTTEHDDFFLYNEWWSGRSKLCEKLMLEKILKRDVGLEALPPSFIRGKEDVSRRREKIKAAKVRISDIATASGSGSSKKRLVCFSDGNGIPSQEDEDEGDCGGDEDGNSGGKRRKKRKYGDIDWEDFIIETLLLHQVREEEIEKGHYNTLLDLHVFRSDD